MYVALMGRILGLAHIQEILNIDNYMTSKFNCDSEGKLLKVFEELSNQGSAFKDHNKLKAEMGSKKVRIEPKGMEAYEVNNCARYWFNSNNEGVLRIEGDDRRFTVHHIDDKRANDPVLFAKLYGEVGNDRFVKTMFNYLATRKYEKSSLSMPYSTKSRDDQKVVALGVGLRMMLELGESDLGDLNGLFEIGTNKIMAAKLHGHFKDYCMMNGHKYSASSFKTQAKHIGLVPKVYKVDGKAKRCYAFGKTEILCGFRQYLKNPEFKFEDAIEL
jgi:hypothetical protein